MIAETGVDGVAAARGAIGNPWFFRQVRDLAAGRRAGRSVAWPNSAPSWSAITPWPWSSTASARRTFVMRHFGISYGRIHPHPKRIRMAFVAVRTAEEWRAVLDAYYA